MSWREGNLRRAAALPSLTGRRFGKLTVLDQRPSSAAGKRRWLCRCDCGNEKIVTGGNLSAGRQVSCGCHKAKISGERGRIQKRTHGGTGSPAYRSWAAMKSRCANPNATGFQRYGGAGIVICERWNSFENFHADMGDRPAGHSLDRYPDPAGNYEPSNCRWATPKEQASNKRER